MEYKHYCVIDENSYYIDLVLARGTGADQTIDNYTLSSGEYLLETAPPGGFVRPKWNGESWEEGATTEEITEWEAQQPPPIAPPPNPAARIAELEQQVADLTAAIERGISL